MDQSSFDRIVRLLGGATTRRAGLGVALGSLLGLGAFTDADAKKPRTDRDRDKGKGRGTRDGKPGGEGPCGDRSRKDNVCTKGKDCCTGICKKGIKNKDGKGRCRCLRKGRACTADKNCCSGMTCTAGVCAKGGPTPPPAPVPNGQPCNAATDTCAAAEASCIPYLDGVNGPAGTYCLFAVEAECASDGECSSNWCTQGFCTTCSCSACNSYDCSSPTVVSGGSISSAISSAVDGSIITIGPGTYDEDIEFINKGMKLVGCPSATEEVILKNASMTKRTINWWNSQGYDLEILNIVVQGYNDSTTTGGGLYAEGRVWICGRSRVENCIWAAGGGIFVAEWNGTTPAAELHVLDSVIVQNNTANGSGNTGDGGGIKVFKNSVVEIGGHAVIRNNTAATDGGGIEIQAADCSLTVSGNATITGNTAVSGGGIHSQDSGATITVATGLVTGNSPDQCAGDANGGTFTC